MLVARKTGYRSDYKAGEGFLYTAELDSEHDDVS